MKGLSKAVAKLRSILTRNDSAFDTVVSTPQSYATVHRNQCLVSRATCKKVVGVTNC